MSGLDAVEEILKIDPRVPIIMMTAHGTRDNAIDAIRRGAYDYFTKPFRLEEMEIVIRRALDKRKLYFEIERLREELANVPGHEWAQRGQPGDDRGDAPHRARGADRLDRAHPRRERRGQGTGGRVDPRAVGAQAPALRAPELRGDPRDAARIGAVRLRARRVHRRAAAQARQVRAGRRRHAAARRDRRHDAGHAGQDPPRPAEPRGRARRRHHDRARRRPHHRVDQQGPAAQRPRGLLPRRPVLPPQRDHAPRAVAARAARGDPEPGRSLPGRGQQAPRPVDQARLLGRDGGADGLRLARQHPRAEERHRARGRRHRRRRGDAREPAAAHPAGRRRARRRRRQRSSGTARAPCRSTRR